MVFLYIYNNSRQNLEPFTKTDVVPYYVPAGWFDKEKTDG